MRQGQYILSLPLSLNKYRNYGVVTRIGLIRQSEIDDFSLNRSPTRPESPLRVDPLFRESINPL